MRSLHCVFLASFILFSIGNHSSAFAAGKFRLGGGVSTDAKSEASDPPQGSSSQQGGDSAQQNGGGNSQQKSGGVPQIGLRDPNASDEDRLLHEMNFDFNLCARQAPRGVILPEDMPSPELQVEQGEGDPDRPLTMEDTTLYNTEFWGPRLAQLTCSLVILRTYTLDTDLFDEEYYPLYEMAATTAYEVDGNEEFLSDPIVGRISALILFYFQTESSLRKDSVKDFGDKRQLLVAEIVDAMEGLVSEITLENEVVTGPDGMRFLKPTGSGSVARMFSAPMRKLVNEISITQLSPRDKRQLKILSGHLDRVDKTTGSDGTRDVDPVSKDLINWYDYNEKELLRLAGDFRRGSKEADNVWSAFELKVQNLMAMFRSIKVTRNWGVGHSTRSQADVRKDIKARNEL